MILIVCLHTMYPHREEFFTGCFTPFIVFYPIYTMILFYSFSNNLTTNFITCLYTSTQVYNTQQPEKFTTIQNSVPTNINLTSLQFIFLFPLTLTIKQFEPIPLTYYHIFHCNNIFLNLHKHKYKMPTAPGVPKRYPNHIHIHNLYIVYCL